MMDNSDSINQKKNIRQLKYSLGFVLFMLFAQQKQFIYLILSEVPNKYLHVYCGSMHE